MCLFWSPKNKVLSFSQRNTASWDFSLCQLPGILSMHKQLVTPPQRKENLKSHHMTPLIFYTPGFYRLNRVQMQNGTVLFKVSKGMSAWTQQLFYLFSGAGVLQLVRDVLQFLSLFTLSHYIQIFPQHLNDLQTYSEITGSFLHYSTYEHVQQEHRKSVGRAHYINLINLSHVYPVVITLHNIMHLAEALIPSNLHSRNIHKKHERHSVQTVHKLFVMCMKLITCVTSPLRVSRLRESPSCKMLSFERARWRGVLPARSRASTRAPEGTFIMYELVLN